MGTNFQKKTRRLSWTNAMKLWPGSTLTRQLRRMNSKTRRRKLKVFALQSSKNCMLLLEGLQVVCQEVCQVVCQEVCLEVCQTWVQVLVPEVDQLLKELIEKTVIWENKTMKSKLITWIVPRKRHA